MLKNTTNKTKIITLFLVLSLISSILFVGCGKKQDDEQETGAKPQQTESQKVVVTDGLGRQVEISGKVERIAANYGIGEHMIFALGEQDKLVSSSTPSKKNPFFNALRSDFSSLPSLGSSGEINAEELIALEADLVILAGRNKELIENLEQHGLTVFGVTAEDLDELKDTMDNLGKALGREDRATQFIEYYDDAIEMVQERTKNLKPEERPGVYVVGSTGLLSTCSKDMYQHFLIDLAGGKNVAAEGTTPGQGWFEVSPEQLIKWNPDLMVLVQYTAEATPEQILADGRLQGINAIKDEQVFWFPSELSPWDYPSPQAVLGIKWLAKKIHPDKFQDMDLEKEANDFFMLLYGKTYTELGGSL